MAECRCDFRRRMVGDGCEVCNPALALEFAKETISDLEAEISAVRELPKKWRSRGFRAGQEAEMVARNYYADELEALLNSPR